uniref:Protein tesmin/TSO1-like CXC 5 n=1 Tax=Nicotiana tabacum TaxID=4097 RepID=A0A1S4A6C0_TOBAC|nr:PREDICTED: protein tesmin/TSO1-like CXC 5 [Nicotiana tabacum]
MLSDEKDASLKQAKCHSEASYPSSGVEKVIPDDCSSAFQAENMDESSLDSANVPKERPMSPGTLALMCDEQNTIFTVAAAPPNDPTSLSNNTSSQLPHGQAMKEVYPELEKIVLTRTRDCLKKLITLGELKETKCSSMVRGADSGSQNEVNGNGIAMTDSRNQHEPFRNGVANTVPTPPPPPQKVEPGTTAFNNNPCPKVHPSDGNGDVISKS